MPNRPLPDSNAPLRDRFDFQAGMLAAYLAEALPKHRVRQATIMLGNLVKTGRQTLEAPLEHQPDMHRVTVEDLLR
ncbi:MAG: hypothetical protein AAGJ10_03110 [Bacteroidota bacterium]